MFMNPWLCSSGKELHPPSGVCQVVPFWDLSPSWPVTLLHFFPFSLTVKSLKQRTSFLLCLTLNTGIEWISPSLPRPLYFCWYSQHMVALALFGDLIRPLAHTKHVHWPLTPWLVHVVARLCLLVLWPPPPAPRRPPTMVVGAHLSCWIWMVFLSISLKKQEIWTVLNCSLRSEPVPLAYLLQHIDFYSENWICDFF